MLENYTARGLPPELRDFAASRVAHALAGLAGGFDRVRLWLSGDGSGVVTCRIRVRLAPSGIWVTQESRDAHATAAVERAAEGVARAAGRQLARLAADLQLPASKPELKRAWSAAA